jgi:hypothetical protein
VFLSSLLQTYFCSTDPLRPAERDSPEKSTACFGNILNILAAAATCSRRFAFSLQIALWMEFGVFGVLMTSFPFCRATLLLMDNVQF